MSWLPELPASNKPRLWNLRSKYESEPALYSWLYDPTEDDRWYSHVPKDNENEEKEQEPTPEPQHEPKLDFSGTQNNVNTYEAPINSEVNEPLTNPNTINENEIEILDENENSDSDNE